MKTDWPLLPEVRDVLESVRRQLSPIEFEKLLREILDSACSRAERLKRHNGHQRHHILRTPDHLRLDLEFLSPEQIRETTAINTVGAPAYHLLVNLAVIRKVRQLRGQSDVL